MNEHECIECGSQFGVKFVHDETEDKVNYCVNCGELLEDIEELDFED